MKKIIEYLKISSKAITYLCIAFWSLFVLFFLFEIDAKESEPLGDYVSFVLSFCKRSPILATVSFFITVVYLFIPEKKQAKV